MALKIESRSCRVMTLRIICSTAGASAPSPRRRLLLVSSGASLICPRAGAAEFSPPVLSAMGYNSYTYPGDDLGHPSFQLEFPSGWVFLRSPATSLGILCSFMDPNEPGETIAVYATRQAQGTTARIQVRSMIMRRVPFQTRGESQEPPAGRRFRGGPRPVAGRCRGERGPGVRQGGRPERPDLLPNAHLLWWRHRR